MYKSGDCEALDEWIEIVEKDLQPVCVEQKQLIELIKKELVSKNNYVDVKKINECIELLETYSEYKLTPFQKFIHAISSGLFKKNGRTVFRKYVIYCGRGFGKNSLASDQAFYLTSNRHGIKKYNVDIVANNEKQAKTSFMDNYDRIGDYPKLKSVFKRTLTELVFLKTNSKILFHTSKAETKDGLRPGTVIFDEVHEYSDYKNIKVFTSALGKIQNPRIFYITTDGYVRGGVLDDLKEDCEKILKGEIPHNGTFPFFCKINKYEEWEDEGCWIKANPMLLYNEDLMIEYRDGYKDAKKSSQMKLEFLTKRLNYPMQDTTMTVAKWEDIQATNQEIPDLDRMECIGGLDYADFKDFAAVGLMFKKDDYYYWIHHTFITRDSLRQNEYKIPIQEAVEKGLVTICEDIRMDPKLIVNWFLDKAKIYNIKKINADRYRNELLTESFKNTGLKIEFIPSGPITDSKLAPVLDLLFATHKIVYGDDMMMRWYTNNVKVTTNAKGNKTYEKIEPILRKTDGFMAFKHAFVSEGEISGMIPSFNRKLKSYTY